jgi:hypothetical protein
MKKREKRKEKKSRSQRVARKSAINKDEVIKEYGRLKNKDGVIRDTNS